MNKIKELYLKHKEVVLYILFGVATTLVDTLMFWIFDSILGEGLYLLSTLLAWALAALFAYFVNKIFVFESRSWKQLTVAKEALEFFGARVVSLGISELGMYLFVDAWGFKNIGFKLLFVNVTGTLIAKVIMSVIVIVLNYFFSKFIIFRKEQDEKSDGEESK